VTAYADELVVEARCGLTFKASRRTFAHIDYTIDLLAQLSPDARLHIAQGCYHDGPLSAGTHDFDAVLDFTISGLSWLDGQAFLRRCGWAAWWRHTGTWAAESAWHFHAISLGYTTRVGVFVPAQVDDYYRHSLGLKGEHASGLDHTWFPPDINATVFDYEEHAPMTPDDKAWLQARLDAQSASIIAGVVGAFVDGAKLTLGAAIRQAANAPGLVRRLGRELGKDLDKREQK
jgi:hypothetical protein